MAPKTACFLVIGNEVLSGRTQDANTRVLANALNHHGIKLNEVRIIPDIREHIVNSVIECRARFDYLFTSGGIGPTHDDITSSCIAEAFGVPLQCHKESFHALEALFPPGEFNKARQRMAWLPRDSYPIKNSISTAPGFSIGNVHVMAGVPEIFQVMVEWLIPQLEKNTPLTSQSWHAFNIYEGDLAEKLTHLQDTFPTLDIGSYPFKIANKRGVSLVAKGYNSISVTQAGNAIKELIQSLGFTALSGEPK